MKRIDFYKRLYYMLFLISLNIVLLEPQYCYYDGHEGECYIDSPLVFSCEEIGFTNCVFSMKTCEYLESEYANETNCPQLWVQNSRNKCFYDSANFKCKEALPCLSVKNCTKENCENAATYDDTTKKCVYDSTNNKCKEEALPCSSVKNPTDEKCKNAPTSDDTIKKCIYDSTGCKEAELCLSVKNPTDEKCKNAPTSDDTIKKCIYDSANNECKEEDLQCLSVKNPTDENCENAPTSDDTIKKCIYDEAKKACQEVDKRRAISKAAVSIVFIFVIILLSFCIFHFIKSK